MKKLKIRILMYKFEYIIRVRKKPRTWSPGYFYHSKTLYSDIIKEKYF